jgi:hypothetical protein
MDTVHALKLDWESGEGSMDLPEELASAPERFQLDVLNDWKHDLLAQIARLEASLHPERANERLQRQRRRNANRRQLCERLSGLRVEMAEPLSNGDVMLHLSNGRSLVLYAYNEDVKLEVVLPARAREHAAQDNTGDYYLREDLPEPVAAQEPHEAAAQGATIN